MKLYDGNRKCPYCSGGVYEVQDSQMSRDIHFGRGEQQREWLIVCQLCLKDRVWVTDHSGEFTEDQSTKQFVFKYGRFSEHSIEEVDLIDGGRRYLKYMLENSTSKEVKERIKEYFEARSIA